MLAGGLDVSKWSELPSWLSREKAAPHLQPRKTAYLHVKCKDSNHYSHPEGTTGYKGRNSYPANNLKLGGWLQLCHSTISRLRKINYDVIFMSFIISERLISAQLYIDM